MRAKLITGIKRAGFYFGELCAFLFVLSIFTLPIAMWVTHIAYCILVEKYLLLIVGAILPPIGMIHGIGIWLGWF